jgi:hypothetical protein
MPEWQDEDFAGSVNESQVEAFEDPYCQTLKKPLKNSTGIR